jgi:hypothetical protein
VLQWADDLLKLLNADADFSRTVLQHALVSFAPAQESSVRLQGGAQPLARAPGDMISGALRTRDFMNDQSQCRLLLGPA